MSKKINTLLTAIVLISLTSLSFASGPNKHNRGQRMAQQLNLSAEQQEQFKSIMQEQRATAKTWRKSHREETRGKLSQVLNDEQMQQFEAMKKQRAEKRQMRKNKRNY